MKSYRNNFGEIVTKWENNKHPDNPNYMQEVFWAIIEKENGQTLAYYHLGSGGKSKFIYDLTKEEILQKYL